MLVDEIRIQLFAGTGGKGAVAFQKVRLARGPTGGDGGNGGSVYFEGVPDVNALMPLAGKKEAHAEDGRDGRGQFLDGRGGTDLILKIPVGTTVTNLATGYAQEIEHVGQRILAAGGGIGGRGNFKFRSAVNTSPVESETGLTGDTPTYRLELRLIADVGLVGLPNTGKSSLLNELTAAKSRVANYAFTTLEPHLGAYYELILADIPGIIEGASTGKGLGVKFLKHIERTKVLFHLISAESDDVARDYKIIRNELENYNPLLTKKTEYVFLTKSDAVAPQELKKRLTVLTKHGIQAMPISILDPTSIDEVKKILNKIKDAK
ncbi:Obg family GTPase CgtA [Candidatus Kaiserbacteria bacterium RIFCSPHIGHO2_01_FULL_53_29]|uniref:GTPase Obg n=1 Tax=Candidatus Kaiserbacteria bacterium RIFCSPHIGHO2_01_FULL_53_29 TaxID=1798480 RepID=A0A1F6CTP7_9BACT|nr:MAG: Obg family GTPase CgtA [Candidatus Kaiserbacteria bacterium RIFCSPHIGHO2_01_FULL_53_29]